MSVKIMIDSASDISEKEAKELGFLFVPIQVRLDGEEYFDGVDLLPTEFFDKLVSSKDMPQTSLINSYRWIEAFENATKNGDQIVAITLSSKISGTHDAAVEAAKEFNGNVVVVDSLNAALGERLLGFYALELAKQNLTLNEIVEKLNEQKNKICLFAVIDTLKYLKKGGRISATTAFFGEMLSIKPIVKISPNTNVVWISEYTKLLTNSIPSTFEIVITPLPLLELLIIVLLYILVLVT